MRWGGIIVKTSLNMIDTASSLVRACPSHLDGSSTSTLIARVLQILMESSLMESFIRTKKKKKIIYSRSFRRELNYLEKYNYALAISLSLKETMVQVPLLTRLCFLTPSKLLSPHLIVKYQFSDRTITPLHYYVVARTFISILLIIQISRSPADNRSMEDCHVARRIHASGHDGI